MDDDEGMRETLTAILRREFRVLRAATGEASLQMMEKEDVEYKLVSNRDYGPKFGGVLTVRRTAGGDVASFDLDLVASQLHPLQKLHPHHPRHSRRHGLHPEERDRHHRPLRRYNSHRCDKWHHLDAGLLHPVRGRDFRGGADHRRSAVGGPTRMSLASSRRRTPPMCSTRPGRPASRKAWSSSTRA